MENVKVFLREKKISKGRKSLYLDFYPAIVLPETGKKTRRQFLGLYLIEKPKHPLDKQHNKETKALAESIRARRQLEIQKGKLGFKSEAKKKADFLNYVKRLADTKFNSSGNYGNWMSAYKHLKNYRESILVEDIDAEFIEGFKHFLNENKRLKHNSKVSYLNKFMAATKQATKDGYFVTDPSKKVDRFKQEETQREFLVLEEIKLLLENEYEIPVFKDAFIFSAFTGLRFSDIKKLRWTDLQQTNGNYFIRIRQKKTKSYQTLPLARPAFQQLLNKEKAKEYIFDQLEYSAWQNRKFKDWIKSLGINKNITFHCARHSFATLQLTLGTDIYTVSKLLGHKELKTTQIYSKIIDEKKAKAIERFNNLNI